MIKDLIYDIGANNGNDTAFYLSLGYRVVAIEANPVLVEMMHKRFNKAIKNNKLTILNIAVTPKDVEVISFYISSDDWRSSVFKEVSARETTVDKEIQVEGISLNSLFTKYGVPYYCKIDIEGYDAEVIAPLYEAKLLPDYISCETSCLSIAEINKEKGLLYKTLNALQQAGYNKFKLIDQEALIELEDKDHYAFLHSLITRMRTKLEKITGLYSKKYSPLLYAKKHGIAESTAAFGKDLKGTWKDYATTKGYLDYHFSGYERYTKNKKLIFWVDIHATKI